MDKYEKIKKIGEGSYGKIESRDRVALAFIVNGNNEMLFQVKFSNVETEKQVKRLQLRNSSSPMMIQQLNALQCVRFAC
jgi:hypothetical protein